MTTETNLGGPTLEQMALEDVISAVPVQDNLKDGPLSHAHVVEGKDGKPDIEATIASLIKDGQNSVSSSIPAAKADHRYLPGFDALKNTFKTIKDGIKDGHYTSRIKDALANVYERSVQENAIASALARIQAAPLAVSKKGAIALATMSSDKYLIPLIEKSDSTAEVASYARTSLESLYTKARQSFNFEGKTGPFKAAYAGAGHK